MNRRSYIKSILVLGATGIASFSVFKWFSTHRSVEAGELSGTRDVLAEIVDVMIPPTDSPGAKEAMVHDYILGVMQHCNSAVQQRKFLTGIEDVQAYTRANYNKGFQECSMEQKKTTIGYLDRNAGLSSGILNKINTRLFGAPFYIQLKKLTVEGYCMSRLGATQGLAYDYIPGSYQACIPLSANQRSWATK